MSTTSPKTSICAGIIGYGKHLQRSHFLAYFHHNRPNFTIRGYFDPSPDTSLFDKDFKTSDDANFIKYETLDELLHDPEINTVFIGSPDQFHADQLKACVEAGLHIFVEKPLAYCPDQFEQVCRSLTMARGTNLIVSTCHPRRTDHHFEFVKKHFSTWCTEMGDLLSIDYRFSYPTPGGERQWKHERGLMIDHISHEIDLVRFLLPYAQFPKKGLTIRDSPYLYEVFGTCNSNKPDGFEKLVSYRFLGRRLNLQTTKRYIETLDLIFERGEVKLNCESGNVIIDNQSFELPNVQTINLGPANFDRKFKKLTNNFLDVIENKLNGANTQVTSYVSLDDILFNTKFPFTCTDY